jgi:hypothetical protein
MEQRSALPLSYNNLVLERYTCLDLCRALHRLLEGTRHVLVLITRGHPPSQLVGGQRLPKIASERLRSSAYWRGICNPNCLRAQLGGSYSGPYRRRVGDRGVTKWCCLCCPGQIKLWKAGLRLGSAPYRLSSC